MEIEIQGHKAKIDSVIARQAGIWHKEDFLMVGISFDEAVEGTFGFAIRLPVRVYDSPHEFVALVKEEAEKTLPELLLKGRQEREKRKREQERQEELDALVGNIKSNWLGMSIRYLEASLVKIQSSAPQFVEHGHCLWCNKPLTGKATKFCRPTEEEKRLYQYNYVVPVVSKCNLRFYNWWYSRPAFVRATFLRDNFTCQQCGLHPMREDKPWLPDISLLECDHIIPLARGGETEMDNLQTLCRECNRKKGVSIEGEPVQDLPRVIPSRDKSKCPSCRTSGYRRLPWLPPEFYDPLMIKVECLRCREESYIAPAPQGYNRRRMKHERKRLQH